MVSAAPAVLEDLSFRFNVGGDTRLDGREKNSKVCIRFLHLRGQKPIQVKNATLELQKGCFQLALEIQKICWPESRKLETSDLEIALCTSTVGRMEGRILLRSRASTSQEMEEDTLVGILMVFMSGNSVPRGPGVDLRWCPLTHRIGITSCALIGVTVRRSLFNLRRREVRFGHQRRGQVEWSLNNSKDPTLRRMVKVLTKSTSGSDLLSFLKDRNWALAREETEQVIDKAGARPKTQVHDTLKEGSEIVMLGEGEEAVVTEMINTSPPSQEAEAKLTSEEESQEVPLNSEEKTAMGDESDDKFEEDEISEKLSSEEEGPEVPFSSEEETEMIDESDDQLEEEGILEDPPPLSSLAEEDQEQRRRRGRTRRRTRGAGRVRETKTLLVSRTYSSHAKMQRDIKSLLHLGLSGRDEELNFSTFDKCTDSTGCGAQGGPGSTASRCEVCTVRASVSGFSPCSTGTRLRRFKTLWLRLRGDRTGTRAVLGDRVLQHPWAGLLKVQVFRAVWQQGTAAKFMGQLREEGFPDLALAGEELLQAEPRGLPTWTTGTRGRSHWGLQSSF